MIAIDTNILVQLLTRDNEEQYQASHNLFSCKDLFIPDAVILETEWVLRHAYELEPVEVCVAMRGVFGLKNVHLANAQTIAQVITWHEQGLDFADAFHLGLSQGHEALKTFDERFAKKANALTDCRVEKP